MIRYAWSKTPLVLSSCSSKDDSSSSRTTWSNSKSSARSQAVERSGAHMVGSGATEWVQIETQIISGAIRLELRFPTNQLMITNLWWVGVKPLVQTTNPFVKRSKSEHLFNDKPPWPYIAALCHSFCEVCEVGRRPWSVGTRQKVNGQSDALSAKKHKFWRSNVEPSGDVLESDNNTTPIMQWLVTTSSLRIGKHICFQCLKGQRNKDE